MQDELLAAIEAGDEQRCAGLLKGLNEAARRALHPAVKRVPCTQDRRPKPCAPANGRVQPAAARRSPATWVATQTGTDPGGRPHWNLDEFWNDVGPNSGWLGGSGE
jgi:uncharacterized protein